MIVTLARPRRSFAVVLVALMAAHASAQPVRVSPAPTSAPAAAPGGTPSVAPTGSPVSSGSPAADSASPPVAEGSGPAESLPVVGRILFTAGVSGHFADPICRDDTGFRATPFERSAIAFRDAALSETSFAFDSGGFFGPHGVGRFAIGSMREESVALVTSMGFDAMAFAAKDLQGERTPFLGFAADLAEAGVRYVASNLRCTAEAANLCDVLDDATDDVRIHERGGERYALITLISPSVLEHVEERNKQGLSLDPLEETLHRRIAEARAAGATVVIVSIDNGAGARAAGDAVDLAEGLPVGDRPDLLVAARAGGELLFARPRTFQPPIASAPPQGAASAELRRRPDVGLELLVRALEPTTSATGTSPIATFSESVGPEYCSVLGYALPGGHLADALDTTALLDLVGGAMRVATGAEIAVVNQGLVSNDFSREAGHALTASDVQLALQFDDPLLVASVDAEYLTTLARVLGSRTDVRAVGLAITNPGASDEAITINGRPIDARATYRIVVPRFLGRGGDGVIASGPDFDERHATVRGSLLAWLSQPRSEDPRDALPNPAEQLEWSFAFASDSSFGDTVVDNPGSYGDTQFERADSIAYGTENQLDLVARSTLMAWENQAIIRYRTTRNLGEPTAEADDLISYRGTFAYREPRTRHALWYVPEPFAEGYLETEFTVPSVRPARHFLVRPTLGLRFTLTSVLALKFQGGGAFEIFDDTVPDSPGIGSVLTLTQWQFFSAGDRSGSLEGNFDWFFSGLGDQPMHTMRGNLDLGIQLNQVLGLSFTSTLFAVKQPDLPCSIVLNTTANLRLSFYARTQR